MSQNFVIDRKPAKKLKFVLASTSQLKKEVAESILTSVNAELFCLDDKSTGADLRAANPINEGGMACALERLHGTIETLKNIRPSANPADQQTSAYDQVDVIIVMENYIQEITGGSRYCISDIGIVLVYLVQEGLLYRTFTSEVEIPDYDLYHQMISQFSLPCMKLTLHQIKEKGLKLSSKGTSITYGKLLHQKNPKIPDNNWTGFYGADRKQLLQYSLHELFDQFKYDQRFLQSVSQKFRYYDNFPKQGVQFMDWNDIFLDSALIKQLIKYLADKYLSNQYPDNQNPPDPFRSIHHPSNEGEIENHQRIDYVLGLESRGYLLAMPLAQELNCGFVALRKPGKLPDPKFSLEYTKEYGTDILELRADLPKGNVLIVDDVLATGGSLQAAAKLAQQAGHTVVDCIVMIDVPSLRQQAKANLDGLSIRVLIKP